MAKQILIGISGWRYPPWRQVFYPKGLIQKRELEFASQALPTIELNGSFYALQRPSSYLSWYEQTPPDFVFSIKATRYITHILRLENIETALANFFASGLLALKEKLGPVLWQFPPSFRFDAALFENFLKQLPHDTEAAAKLAEKRDATMHNREFIKADQKRALRHAVEIRNKSFEVPEFITLLRKYNVALVIADTAGKWPDNQDITADFTYLRLHGAEELYASGYTDKALDHWAARIDAWSKGSQPEDAKLVSEEAPTQRKSRDVYCYFDNDIKVKAPFDARKLLRRLDLESGLRELDWSHADEPGELNPTKARGKAKPAK
ncbi:MULTISPECIES: DUF72 domain-containing protein [unclassified Methylophilus]|uniref:DUF72 domain-containing protein n=1 Tax=unclassified Methylophilus TaxID=2630143 RepID=UPI0006FADF57|nr:MULTISPECIES: DUF72 domain-containing protein [unclassified Methylophilus]KQT41175.1 hypothetical protein ASG34_10455 [Methylophilus sp. Leaf416]KQT58385.1 hypothetical protein ASG44_12010 [Methylophilus sp. Leaf459]